MLQAHLDRSILHAVCSLYERTDFARGTKEKGNIGTFRGRRVCDRTSSARLRGRHDIRRAESLPMNAASAAEGRDQMPAMSRTQARSEHTAQAGEAHAQFSETIYGVLCAGCRNYILIDKTNCPPSCREHEACRQAYA